MPELRTVGSILEDYSAAERELARAPEEEWLAILAIMDQLYTEFLEAVARSTDVEEPCPRAETPSPCPRVRFAAAPAS